MFQRSEIGKRRSKKSIAEAKLNRLYVTPNGEHYSLVSFYKKGKKYRYEYEWIDCPQKNGKNLFLNKIESEFEFGVEDIMKWIEDLKSKS